MQLKNDSPSWNMLRETVYDHYKINGARCVSGFLDTQNEEWGWTYQHFLLDRKHIFKYGIGVDRGVWMGGVSLAIGPHYFGPADFWNYAASERFKIDATVSAVQHNLRLLDEFLGYRAVGPP